MSQKKLVASSAKSYSSWYFFGLCIIRVCIALMFLCTTASLVMYLPQFLDMVYEALAGYGLSFFVGTFFLDVVLRPGLVFLGACLSWYGDAAFTRWQDSVLCQGVLVAPKAVPTSELSSSSGQERLCMVNPSVPIQKKQGDENAVQLIKKSGQDSRWIGSAQDLTMLQSRTSSSSSSSSYSVRQLRSWAQQNTVQVVPDVYFLFVQMMLANSRVDRSVLRLSLPLPIGQFAFSLVKKEKVSSHSVWENPLRPSFFGVAVQETTTKPNFFAQGGALSSNQRKEVTVVPSFTRCSLALGQGSYDGSSWWLPILAEYLAQSPALSRGPVWRVNDSHVSPLSSEHYQGQQIEKKNASGDLSACSTFFGTLSMSDFAEYAKDLTAGGQKEPIPALDCDLLYNDDTAFIQSVLRGVFNEEDQLRVTLPLRDNQPVAVTSVGSCNSVERLIKAWEQGREVANDVSDLDATISVTSDVRARTNGRYNTFYQNDSVLIVPTVVQDSESYERCESSGCTYSSNTGQ